MKYGILAFLITMISPLIGWSGDTQSGSSLRDWYVQNYDFFTIKDTAYTFETEFKFPEGYHRLDSTQLSPFQFWMSHFPLWHRWKPIGSWKGGKAFEADQISRAVHLPWRGMTFRDYAIPIRIVAEYLFSQDRREDFQVVPKLGDTLRYTDWLSSREVYDGRGAVKLIPDKQREDTPREYYHFVDVCMRNTSYKSLAENCDSIPEAKIAPGDLFLAFNEKGTKGVVYVILNVLEDDSGNKLYVAATGCPEACDFHIPLFNLDRDFPWIPLERIKQLGKDFPFSGFYRFRIL